MAPTKPFPPGIHVPSLTWFADDASQEIDWTVQTKHIDFLVKSGLHGVVLAGTNGEAVTLTAEEKTKLVKTTRELAVAAGRPDLAITLGCGGQSTRDVIAETKLAAAAGADFALVLVPSYFHFAMNEDAIVGFFEELADASPVPVIIYNFPGVAAGLDVNSDMLSRLGKHPNIIGVKLTCGGIAKVARVRAEFEPSQFFALAGQSDWLVPAMAVGGTGTITGVANLYPKYCIEIFDLYNAGKLQEASAAQLKLAQMEWAFGKGGINGTKWVVAKSLGYPLASCHCRRPYPQYGDEKKQAWISGLVAPLAEEEAKLNQRA
ncbi:4-hydroxy-2-oxoglutarate aldolase, mitochondrial 5 [Colletotrichum plurivorum]|uniref:4-hydroxy-2-oxoglutarate aldolase, mitochondrial 5 n=1 Tax=Colletotrichum plurivorum TaxID=2175906 RepID=A0A8H6N8L4_9PEZI|nr:4-hydroxy-2-oxoglutarate aldolase, mitochondrial 5 [Colletotrichum plurivorum]